MYLHEIITKDKEKIKVNNILSKVLKIKIEEKQPYAVKSEKETINFLTEHMIKEIKRALK